MIDRWNDANCHKDTLGGRKNRFWGFVCSYRIGASSSCIAECAASCQEGAAATAELNVPDEPAVRRPIGQSRVGWSARGLGEDGNAELNDGGAGTSSSGGGLEATAYVAIAAACVLVFAVQVLSCNQVAALKAENAALREEMAALKGGGAKA